MSHPAPMDGANDRLPTSRPGASELDITPATFLKTWFGSQAPGWVVSWNKGKKIRIKAFSGPNYAEDVASHALDMDGHGFDAYFGLCPLGFKPADGQRGKAEDTCLLPGLWVEIDVQGAGHASDKLCPDLAAALALVAQFPLPPTMLVHSGGGIHCYWVFSDPLKLNQTGDREQARQMTDRFQDFFRRPEVNPNGYKVDSTADLARVLRVPGTHNHKEATPRPVTVLEYDPTAVVTVECLLSAIPPEPKKSEPKAAPTPSAAAPINSSNRPTDLKRAQAYIEGTPGAGQGGRNNKAHQLACKLQNDFALGLLEEAYGWFQTWNQKNSPPLGEAELRTCWESASTSAKGPQGAALEEVPAYAQPGTLERAWSSLAAAGKLKGKEARLALKEGRVLAPALRPRALEMLSAHLPDLVELGFNVEQIQFEEAEREANRPQRDGVWEVKTARIELTDKLKGRLYSKNLPIVAVKDYPPQVIMRSILEVLRESNQANPRFFNGPAGLSFLNLDAPNPQIQALTTAAGVQMRFGELANFVHVCYDKDSETEKLSCVPCPKPMAEQIKELSPEEMGVPEITRLVRTPMFSRDGVYLNKTRYYPESRLALKMPDGLQIPAVHKTPSKTEVDQARALLVADLLGDFPFMAQSDRANALALLVSLFTREMTGLTPLTMVEASTPRTGKTLLVEVILCVFCGLTPAGELPSEVFKMAELGKDEEAQKILCSALLAGPSVLFLDNISRKLDCPPLALTLTSSNPSFRILGSSRMVTLPNSGVWVGTANNPTYSDENSRRVATVRLDAGLERPEERTAYRIPNIISWAKENRPKLIWAVITLIQNWVIQGRPRGRQTLGGFQQWAEVLGGILECAEVTGFLDNRVEVLERSDPDSQEWRSFFSAWWQESGSQRVSCTELASIVRRINVPSEAFSAATEQSQVRILGKALNKRLGRVFGGLKLESARHDMGRAQYRLRPNTAEIENALRAESNLQDAETYSATASSALPLVAQEQMMLEASAAIEGFEL